MSRRGMRVLKWTAVILAAAATAGIGLLMTQPPSAAILQRLANSVMALWEVASLEQLSYAATLVKLLEAGALVVVLWFAARLTGRLIRAKFLDHTTLEEGRKFAMERMSTYLLFAFGALIGIQALGVDVSSLTVFSGALGIGLGLGFQTIARNLASGLILLFDQTVKVGDRVELGALQGDILSIGTRATRVRTNDNAVIIVPNSEFTDMQVTNLTHNDRNVRMRVPVGVSYGSDPEKVRSILVEVGTSYPDVLDDPAPDVIFTGFGESSLDFELRVWTERQMTRPRLFVSQLYFEVFAAFKREGIEIPFPQRDLHLRTVPTDLRGAPESAGARPETGGQAGGRRTDQ